MIAAWGAAEWFWNALTLGVGAIVSVIALFILVRVVEPKGMRAFLRKRS